MKGIRICCSENQEEHNTNTDFKKIFLFVHSMSRRPLAQVENSNKKNRKEVKK